MPLLRGVGRHGRLTFHNMKRTRIIDVLEFVAVTMLTLSVIMRYDLAIYFAVCFLMGRQVGHSITNFK